MTKPNRVIRLKRNPKARGFLVIVQEEESRNEFGSIVFRNIEVVACGTRAKADKVWNPLKAKYGIA